MILSTLAHAPTRNADSGLRSPLSAKPIHNFRLFAGRGSGYHPSRRTAVYVDGCERLDVVAATTSSEQWVKSLPPQGETLKNTAFRKSW